MPVTRRSVSIQTEYCLSYPSEGCPMVREQNSDSGKSRLIRVCSMYRMASTGSGTKAETGCLRRPGESPVKDSTSIQFSELSLADKRSWLTSIVSWVLDLRSEDE